MENTSGGSQDRPGWFSSLLAFVGSIIIIVIILWGLVNIVNLMNPWITSFFPKASTAQPATNTLPKTTITNAKLVTTGYTDNGSTKEGQVMKKSAAHAPSGPADLSVRIIAVGVIENGTFIARTPSIDDMVAVHLTSATMAAHLPARGTSPQHSQHKMVTPTLPPLNHLSILTTTSSTPYASPILRQAVAHLA